MSELREALRNSRVCDPEAKVRLKPGRPHEFYHGPVYQPCPGVFMIWYQDTPTHVNLGNDEQWEECE